MTTNAIRLMAGIAAGLGAAILILMNWQELARLRAERKVLERELSTMRGETEQTASRLGQWEQMSRQCTLPSSEVLRLRGKVTRLSQELMDLKAAWPSNHVSAVNRAQRDKIALQAAELFESRKLDRSYQLSSVFQALNQIALRHSDFNLIGADGKVAPGVFQMFPSMPWDEVKIFCHDSKALRFLQRWHPDEIVIMFVQPLLDPAGERICIGIRASGEILSAPEASLHHYLRFGSGKQAGEAALLREWKQFKEGP